MSPQQASGTPGTGCVYEPEPVQQQLTAGRQQQGGREGGKSSTSCSRDGAAAITAAARPLRQRRTSTSCLLQAAHQWPRATVGFVAPIVACQVAQTQHQARQAPQVRLAAQRRSYCLPRAPHAALLGLWSDKREGPTARLKATEDATLSSTTT